MLNKKWTFWEFREYEGETLSRYLEQMAQKGWRLVKMMPEGGLIFQKGEPEICRYYAGIMPGETKYSEEESEEKRRFCDLCEDAGWKFVCGRGAWQVFRTEEREILPVETDLQLQIKAVGKALFSGWRILEKTIVSALLFAMLGKILARPSDRAELRSAVPMVLMLLLTLYLNLRGIMSSFFWYRKVHRAFLTNGAIPQTGISKIKARTFVTVILFFSIFGIVCREEKMLHSVVCLYFFLSSYHIAVSYAISQSAVPKEERIWACIRVCIVYLLPFIWLLTTADALLSICL